MQRRCFALLLAIVTGLSCSILAMEKNGNFTTQDTLQGPQTSGGGLLSGNEPGPEGRASGGDGELSPAGAGSGAQEEAFGEGGGVPEASLQVLAVVPGAGDAFSSEKPPAVDVRGAGARWNRLRGLESDGNPCAEGAFGEGGGVPEASLQVPDVVPGAGDGCGEVSPAGAGSGAQEGAFGEGGGAGKGFPPAVDVRGAGSIWNRFRVRESDGDLRAVREDIRRLRRNNRRMAIALLICLGYEAARFIRNRCFAKKGWWYYENPEDCPCRDCGEGE